MTAREFLCGFSFIGYFALIYVYNIVGIHTQ